MPMWPSRYCISRWTPQVRNQIYLEKIRYRADDSIKSLQFLLSNGNTSMIFGTSYVIDKEIPFNDTIKTLARIDIYYKEDRRGLFGIDFFSRTNKVLMSIKSKNMEDCTKSSLNIS